jgi:hypothetical protein
MTHFRLGKPDEARRWLARARTWIDLHAGEPALTWLQRLELTLLRSEAEQLLGVTGS